jgi:peptide/nickel transport system permease protein
MAKYIGKRLLLMIPVVIGVAIVIFTIMYFVPGDPATIILGTNATEVELAAKRSELGLDQPYLVRLAKYMSDIFLHADFGKSYINNTDITTELLGRLPRTMLLGIISIALSLIIGVPLGISAAVHQGTWLDSLCMLIALVGVSMPTFWVALLLVILFALKLGILPAMGIGGIQYYILPCVANCFGGLAMQARQSRSSMLEVLNSDYIVMARSKGLSEHNVVYHHALPNALIPVITIAGTSFGSLLGGGMLVETIFSIPGVGYYMVKAVNSRDYPAVQGSILLLAIAFSICMLITDLVMAYVDPRIKSQFAGKKKRTAKKIKEAA